MEQELLERKLNASPWFGSGWIIRQSECLSEGVYKIIAERNGYQMEYISDSNQNKFIVDKKCKRCEKEYDKSCCWDPMLPVPGPYCSKECAHIAQDTKQMLKPLPKEKPKIKGLDLWTKKC
jgi:hypothetical protein